MVVLSDPGSPGKVMDKTQRIADEELHAPSIPWRHWGYRRVGQRPGRALGFVVVRTECLGLVKNIQEVLKALLIDVLLIVPTSEQKCQLEVDPSKAKSSQTDRVHGKRTTGETSIPWVSGP